MDIWVHVEIKCIDGGIRPIYCFPCCNGNKIIPNESVIMYRHMSINVLLMYLYKHSWKSTKNPQFFITICRHILPLETCTIRSECFFEIQHNVLEMIPNILLVAYVEHKRLYSLIQTHRQICMIPSFGYMDEMFKDTSS